MNGSLDEKGLGQRLQAARRAGGLTQQELCHKAGISYSTLAKIERGAIKSPSIFTIQNIAAALGVGLDSLLGGAPVPAAMPVKAKLTAESGVKFVYFDINGCLVRFFHAAFTALAADAHVSADEVETAFWHYNDDVCRGDMTMAQFNATLAKQLGVKHLDWQRYYLSAVEPVAEMHRLVEWVAERYHMGLLSNIMPGFIDTMRSRQLLPAVTYDAIVDSSQVGAIKPERRIYEVATDQAGVKPEEILLIDDDRANLMAADHLGWRVLWFDGYHPKEAAERIKDALKPAA